MKVEYFLNNRIEIPRYTYLFYYIELNLIDF